MILVLFLHCEWLQKECLICLELSLTNLLPLAVEHLLETCGVTSLVFNECTEWLEGFLHPGLEFALRLTGR